MLKDLVMTLILRNTIVLLTLLYGESIFANNFNKEVDRVYYDSMKTSLINLLDVTNFFERRNYVYQVEARQLLENYNRKEGFTKESVDEFAREIGSFKQKIERNPRVDFEVKEMISSKFDQILQLIERAELVAIHLVKENVYKEQIQELDKKIKAGPEVKIVEKKIIQREKSYVYMWTSIVAVFITLSLAGIVTSYFARKNRKLISKLKSAISSIGDLKGAQTYENYLKSVFPKLQSPMSVATNFDGDIISSTKSFKLYFKKYINKNSNWDDFFDKNFYKEQINNEMKLFSFKKNCTDFFTVESNVLSEEKIRVVSLNKFSASQLLAMKSFSQSQFRAKEISAYNILEKCVSNTSHAYKFSNFVISESGVGYDLSCYVDEKDFAQIITLSLSLARQIYLQQVSEGEVSLSLARENGNLVLRTAQKYSSDAEVEFNEMVRSVKEIVEKISQNAADIVINRSVKGAQVVLETVTNIYDLEVGKSEEYQEELKHEISC